MGSVRKVCPRGHQALVPIPSGVYCLLCGYEETEDSLSLQAADLMAAVPGAPLPMRGERHDEEVRRTKRRAARKRSPVALAAHGGLPLVTASSVEQLRERVKGER